MYFKGAMFHLFKQSYSQLGCMVRCLMGNGETNAAPDDDDGDDE